MNNIVLLGDSIFDNAAYIEAVEPAVIEQLQAELLDGDRATLLALDGSVAQDVRFQLNRLPADATHVVISAGGNDALRAGMLLQQSTQSGHALLEELSSIKQQFRLNYEEMLGAVLTYRLPTILCTIYDQCPLSDPVMAGLMFTALSMFNDIITRNAAQHSLPLLDLRLLCHAPGDYSTMSAIEPSQQGGEKIAKAIAAIVDRYDFHQPYSAMFC